MSFVFQWDEIERTLPENWDDVRLVLTVRDGADADRAAALLAPANPGRRGNVFPFSVERRGPGPGPVRRLLRRLDEERIDGTLEPVAVDETEPAQETRRRPKLAEAWDAALETLPDDWSDLVAEVGFDSSDYLERAALLMSPLNPTRSDGKSHLRFRVARRFGYGASAGMTRRCLERLDEERITGELHIAHVVSDSKPVGTQGPVWYVGGRTV